MTTKTRDYTYTVTLCASCRDEADLTCEDCQAPICERCWSRSAYGLAWELLSRVGRNVLETRRMPPCLCQSCAGELGKDAAP